MRAQVPRDLRLPKRGYGVVWCRGFPQSTSLISRRSYQRDADAGNIRRDDRLAHFSAVELRRTFVTAQNTEEQHFKDYLKKPSGAGCVCMAVPVQFARSDAPQKKCGDRR
jgi:hypothetical protein